MQKLGAIDANFLYTETEMMPNHVGSVQYFQLPEDVNEDEFIVGLKGFLDTRKHLVAYMTRKLKQTPGNFDHPVWVKDHNFDINNHVVEVPVPAPGERAEVEATISEITSELMDREKPLWMLHVLTGLPDNQVAYYFQTHHSAIDGVSGQIAIMTLCDETPDHPAVVQPEETASLEDDDSMAELFQQSFQNMMNYQLGAASRMMGSMDASRRLMARMIDPSREMGAYARQAERTRFNHSIEKARSWASGEFSVDEIKKLGKPLGCTINDVVMAICAGGLRRYLKRAGELPSEGLIAGCPVSLRKPGDTNYGNQVTMMNVDLNTQEINPLMRLMEIHHSAIVAKEVTADLSAAMDFNTSILGLPAMVTAMTAASERTHLADLINGPINLVISNVPGPRNTLYSNGAKMLSHHPVSIPAHGVGLNITVQSYDGTMFLGVTACKKVLPDADRLRDDMLEAFAELKRAMQPVNIADFRNENKSLVPSGDSESPAEPKVA